MGITRWHYGKLVLLWAWGMALMALAVRILGALDEERFALGTVLVLAVMAVPIALSVITWKWLGGREQRPK